MALKQLRRECGALVDRLDLPVPFDAHELCRRLARSRGRPIRLVPIAISIDGPCGVWLAVNDTDYIFYEKRTSRLHQEHIILHEVGHLVCHHHPTSALDDETAGVLMPDLDPRMIERVLRRGAGYSAPQEQQAEMIASLILQEVSTGPVSSCRTALPETAVAPGAAGILARLELSLAHRLRRSGRG